MRRVQCGFVAVGAVLTMSGAAVVAATTASAASRASWCTPGASVAAATVGTGFSAATCDADSLVIVDGAAAVRMPARGQAVTATVLTTSGDRVLTVARAADGSVAVRRDGATPTAPSTAAAACSTSSASAYTLLGYHVAGAYRWSYNGAGAPGSVAGVAAGTLKAATSDVTTGRDDCGIVGKPKTSHTYLGGTGVAPGVTASASCGSNDGKSVTGWKSLTATGVLAVTCTYYNTSTNAVAASDAAINTRYRWTTSKSGCSNAYDLRGVMTHERGHTFGLGHTTRDAGQTMYPSVRACDFSKSTLGRGDLTGLFKIYGKA